MTRLTGTGGTGARAMSALRGGSGAKTGSAEVDGQETSDSGFTGFRGDLVAAAMTERGGRGGGARRVRLSQLCYGQAAELTRTGRDSRVVALVLTENRRGRRGSSGGNGSRGEQKARV